MASEEISAICARVQDSYMRLDAAALAAQYAENCIVESPFAGAHVGRLAVERALRDIFAAFPDQRIHTDELLIVDNRADWTFRAEGTDTGGFMGLPPTGKPFSSSAVILYTFGDDYQIVHERRILDFSRLLLQLAGEAGPATEGPQLYRETLERARQEQELKMAAEIQRALFPPSRYQGIGFEVAATSVPCRAIGGDFVDYFNLANGAFAFVLGDVAGKGPPAALLAAMLQGVLAANAHRGGTPADTMTETNEALVRRGIESRFATAVYAVLSCDGRLAYCNAGHNPPLLIRKCGVQRLERGGPIVGAFEQATFEEETLQLEPGDVLVAFSDGVSEARNTDGVEFGERRLLSCVRTKCGLTPTALLESILAAVHDFSAGATQSDDLTVLVLRYSGTETLAA
jgi:serine phosphatase RsbU (regulator of sigma subunit)/predicted ester cyclase